MMSGDAFARSPIGQVLSSPFGRVVRVMVGIVIAGWGYLQSNAAAGIVLMMVGAVPFVAGLLNVCLVSALLGGPIDGERIAFLKRPR